MRGPDDIAGESVNDVSPDDSSEVRGHPSGEKKRSGRSTNVVERDRHTRTSAAWAAVVVAVLFGVALIDFIAQNTKDVRIEFFTASGRLPIAVALLAAALAGAVVVLAVGASRVVQLRLNLRRQRHKLNSQNGTVDEPRIDDSPDDGERSSGHE